LAAGSGLHHAEGCMSTSLTLEAGVGKPTNQHLIVFSVLALLVGRQEEHPAHKKLSYELMASLSVCSEMICMWSS